MRSVALIVHEYTPLGDNFYGIFNPQQRRAAALTFGPSLTNGSDYSSKNKQALSLQPTASAHMSVSLVIALDVRIPLEVLREHVLGGRFAGGTIISVGQAKAFEDIEDALENIKNGFVVMDRRDLLEKVTAEQRAQAFVDALGHCSQKNDGLSWLSATCLGYAGISPYAKRSGVRYGYDHAFAEPLAGLVQYVSLRQCVDDERGADSLWYPEWLADDVFRIYQKSNI